MSVIENVIFKLYTVFIIYVFKLHLNRLFNRCRIDVPREKVGLYAVFIKRCEKSTFITSIVLILSDISVF